MKIHFYIPKHVLPAEGELEGWRDGNPPNIRQSSKIATAQCWIYLTYIRLKNAGFEVILTHEIFGEGIFVALTGNLMPDFRPPKNIYLVGVAADGMLHHGCHFHILQNPLHSKRLPRSAYVPHWPQPCLIRRDQTRGDQFENLYFFGDSLNLAPEFRKADFRNRLKIELGLNLVFPSANRWHDYSEADCILAIRELSLRMFINKPSTKLYNGWLAGVPVIGGWDSAFRADGRSNINFLACKDMNEVYDSLKQLKDNPALRLEIVAQGKIAAREFTPEAITSRWINILGFIRSSLATAYFSESTFQRKITSCQNWLNLTFDKFRGGC